MLFCACYKSTDSVVVRKKHQKNLTSTGQENGLTPIVRAYFVY